MRVLPLSLPGSSLERFRQYTSYFSSRACVSAPRHPSYSHQRTLHALHSPCRLAYFDPPSPRRFGAEAVVVPGPKLSRTGETSPARRGPAFASGGRHAAGYLCVGLSSSTSRFIISICNFYFSQVGRALQLTVTHNSYCPQSSCPSLTARPSSAAESVSSVPATAQG
jgi:hypothetical protein